MLHDLPTPIAPDRSTRADAPLSVALLCPGWPPDSFTNGVVTSVAASVDGLRRLGHRADIFASKVVGGDGHEHVFDLRSRRAMPGPVGRLLDGLSRRLAPDSYRIRRSLATGAVIGRLAAERGTQLVEMEESFGAVRQMKRRVAPPIVVRLHGPWFLNGPLSGAAEDAAFRRRIRDEGAGLLVADAISAPSQDVLDRTRAYYGFPLEGAEVIPNPVPIVPADRRWRLADCDPNLIVFIGRFDRHKGGDIIVDAFARVLERRPRARLRFVGPDRGVTDDDGRRWDLPGYLRARLPQAVATGQVEWLGRQPHAALHDLRRQALVTVVCSRYDNFPTTVMEAISLGCPLVASRIGGATEIIEDGVDGLLCTPGSPADLAETLSRLLAEPDRAAELGRRAAEKCERRFSPEVVAVRTVEFYRRVIGQGRVAAARIGA